MPSLVLPFLRQINVIVYQGNVRSREVLRKYEWDCLPYSVVLITYEILHQDFARLQEKHWRLLVADEAHKKCVRHLTLALERACCCCFPDPHPTPPG